jgi:serine/threonine protein phosphatase PrpC
MRVGVLSDIGKRREKNEDGYLVNDPVFAVADGMGGHSAGEVASAIALKTVKQTLGRITDAKHMSRRLIQSIEKANAAVYERSETEIKKRGMGTTLTVSILLGNRFFVGHVGDSRAYLLRNGNLSQITEDHSWVAEMVKKGVLSPEQAETHPQRSMLTRALGIERAVHIDTSSLEVKAGNKLLLCTDGLTSMLNDQQIEKIVSEPLDPQSVCRKLVDTANQEGGHDNITTIVIEIEDVTEPNDKTPWWKKIF